MTSSSPARGLGRSSFFTGCSGIVPTRGFPRYDSYYAKAPFPLERIRVQCAGEWLRLEWAEAQRLASRLLGR